MIRHNAAEPLYQQIRDLIRREIREGRYADGDKLPSEREMCESYGVSRIPVRKALELLEAEGLITSHQGKGSFVRRPVIRDRLVHISTFAQTLAQQGYRGYTKIISFEEHSYNTDGALLLQTDGCGVSRLMLLGYAEEEPVVFYDSCLQKPVGLRFHKAAMAAEAEGEAFSTFDLYGRTMTTIGKVDQRVLAVNADARISSILQIPEGTAVLVLETVILDEGLRTVEYKRGYYRTDKYSFQLHRSL